MLIYTPSRNRSMTWTNQREVSDWLQERRASDIYRIRAYKGHPMYDSSCIPTDQITVGWGVRNSKDHIYHTFVKKYDA